MTVSVIERNNIDWADLPEELLILVSNLLPQDTKTIGLVCWSWRAVVAPSPWLMFHDRGNKMWKFIRPNGVLNKDFPQLYNAEIRCSKYGWLLMSGDDASLFFFDPYNSSTIELPYTEYLYDTMSFFHLPTSPHCFIFAIANGPTRTTLHIAMLRGGEDKWMHHSIKSKFRFQVSICTPVLHCGLLYCLDVNGNIGICDIKGQFSQRSWMVYTNYLSPLPLFSISKQHLFKIQGINCVFAVFVLHEERKVKVYRLSKERMTWKLVEDLGEKVLFVSHTATFANTRPLKGMKNKIYFPMLHKDKGVFYDLDTQKYHTFDGHAKINSYGFKQLRFATWYVPSFTQELPKPWHL